MTQATAEDRPEPGHPIELTPPDIEPYRAGNTGVPYPTTRGSTAACPGSM